MSERRKPDMSWKAGPCGLAFWREKKKDNTGREYDSYTIALSKAVRTADGEFKDSTVYLYPTDISHIENLLDTFKLNFMVKPTDQGG